MKKSNRGGPRKNQIGRRKGKIANPRRHQTPLRLNDAELDQYTAAALAEDLDRSKFVRMVVAEYIRNNGRRPMSILTLRKISAIRNALPPAEIEDSIVEFWRGLVAATRKKST